MTMMHQIKQEYQQYPLVPVWNEDSSSSGSSISDKLTTNERLRAEDLIENTYYRLADMKVLTTRFGTRRIQATIFFDDTLKDIVLPKRYSQFASNPQFVEAIANSNSIYIRYLGRLENSKTHKFDMFDTSSSVG